MAVTTHPIRRALISVSDKTGIVEFAQALHHHSVEILSTGETYALLVENDIPIIKISDYTGFPEIMDGQIKALHPKVQGGILSQSGQDELIMDDHGIKPIDLVVVNLYPFERTIAHPACDLATAIENIDIGGPTMVRAAAKNYRDTIIIVNTGDYQCVLDSMANNDEMIDLATRFDFAVKAFEHTADYDDAIANYLGAIIHNDEDEPETYGGSSEDA